MNAVESALDSPQGHKGVHEYGIVQKQDLLDLVLLTRTEISKEDRSRVMVMITMDAHSRDTIADLVKQEVDDKGQFRKYSKANAVPQNVVWYFSLEYFLLVHSSFIAFS